jgi:glycosyltransferase involved in cell wall biosynthesis
LTASAPRKILYVHLGGEIGGAPLSMIQLAQTLPPSELRPVLVFSSDGPMVNHARDLGLETRVVPFRDSFFYGAHIPFRPSMVLRLLATLRSTTRRMESVMVEVRPSLVHLNTSVLLQPALAAHRLGIPVIWHVREVLGDLTPVRMLQAKLINRLSTRIIANSDASGEPFVESGKLERIYNGIDTQLFRPGTPEERSTARSELGLPAEALVIGMVGSVQAPKGHFLMLDAFEQLCNRFPDVRLLLVAGGVPEGYAESWKGRVKRALKRPYGLLEDFLQRAERRGLLDRIQVTGYRLDVHRVLWAVDVLAFPSQKAEGFGRPIVEAMAAGLPVVAANVGASPELVLHSETGLLAPPGDARALADALGWILARPDLRDTMGAAGRERAVTRFSETTYAETVMQVYRSVLADSYQSARTFEPDG